MRIGSGVGRIGAEGAEGERITPVRFIVGEVPAENAESGSRGVWSASDNLVLGLVSWFRV